MLPLNSLKGDENTTVTVALSGCANGTLNPKLGLTIPQSRRHFSETPMNRFWQILALLMLALIVPASTCCLWAKGGDSAEKCCSCPGDKHDAPAQPETCPSVTIAHSQMPAQVVLPAMQMIELAKIIHEMMRMNELAAAKAQPVPLMTTAPPQLQTTWAFLNRAALLARAPAELA